MTFRVEPVRFKKENMDCLAYVLSNRIQRSGPLTETTDSYLPGWMLLIIGGAKDYISFFFDRF